MRGRKNWTIGQTTTTEPNFDVVFIGYDRREVEQYSRAIESQVADLLAEQQESRAQVRMLTEQLHLAQTEVIDLRRRPALDDKLGFGHLGLRIEEILTLAVEQAEAIRVRAQDEAAGIRAEADQVLAEARQRHRQSASDFESVFAAMRAEAEQDIEHRWRQVDAELTRAREATTRAHDEAERVVASAHTEAQRIAESSRGEAERIRAEASAQARAIRAKAEEEASALAAAAEQYARETRAAAEQHAARVHAAALAGELGSGPASYQSATVDLDGPDLVDGATPNGGKQQPAAHGTTA